MALAGLAMLSSPAGAAANDGASRGGVTAVARATATIAQAAELRTSDLLAAAENRYAEAEGLTVAPIGISRRDCASEEEERSCRLVVLDLP